MGYSTQRAASGREVLPDLIRSIAILGIVLVNVGFFAYPAEDIYGNGGLATTADKVSFGLVNALFTWKSYSLFSLMFGVGLAFQMVSAERKDENFAPRYWRRIIGLLCLGLLHFCFFFIGDILITYAVMGGALFLMRDMDIKPLTITGVVLIFVSAAFILLGGAAMLMGEAFAPEDMQTTYAEMMANADIYRDAFTTKGFFELAGFRATQLWLVLMFIMTQGVSALGYFCLGLAAVKSGMIADPSHPRWAMFRKYLLPIGLLGSIFGAYLYSKAEMSMSGDGMLAMGIISLFAPLSTAGYAGLIAKWAQGPMQGFKKVMARGGTATLSAYLLQSVILSYVFSAYGLDLYGQWGAARCIALALGVGIFTLGFVSLWRTKFARGPMEIPFRRWTYWGSR